MPKVFRRDPQSFAHDCAHASRVGVGVFLILILLMSGWVNDIAQRMDAQKHEAGYADQ